MSADRWSICPSCTRRFERSIESDQAVLDDAYGTVPLDVFDQMRTALDAKRKVLTADTNDRYTLREDYEFFGIAEGYVTASYTCACNVCDLHLSFERTVLLPMTSDES